MIKDGARKDGLLWLEGVLLFKDFRPAGLIAHKEGRGWFFLMQQHFTNPVPRGTFFTTLEEAIESAHNIELVNQVPGMILGDRTKGVGLAFAQKKKNGWHALMYEKSDMIPLPGAYDSLTSIIDHVKERAESGPEPAAEPVA
jgi:hypothetical protein